MFEYFNKELCNFHKVDCTSDLAALSLTSPSLSTLTSPLPPTHNAPLRLSEPRASAQGTTHTHTALVTTPVRQYAPQVVMLLSARHTRAMWDRTIQEEDACCSNCCHACAHLLHGCHDFLRVRSCCTPLDMCCHDFLCMRSCCTPLTCALAPLFL
jgi:hypothetical protein